MKQIAWLKQVLGSEEEIYKIIVTELEEIKEKYGDTRRTKIERSSEEFADEDLIAKEEMIISMTAAGYIKRIAVDEYRLQKRGGKGLKGSEQREEDYVARLFSANTHTMLLSFSDRGKLYWTKVHELPLGSRTSKGKAINNVVQLSSGENVRAVLPIEEFKEENYIVMLTEGGTIKKTSLEAFSRPRPSGLIALTIDLEDNLIDAKISTGKDDIFIVTKEGMSIRFDEDDVRAMGRAARGVKGVTLGKDDKVIGMEIISKDSKETILIVTANGFGKRTSMEEYRLQGRGGVGLITQKTTDKVGHVVSARLVNDKHQILMTTNSGQAIRMRCSDISTISRNTQGVKLMNLNEGEFVTSVALLEDEGEEAETVDAKTPDVKTPSDKQ
jgi:DNA gyrase subunit A